MRMLLRQPLPTGVLILTLALGLGANAATFGMIDNLLLRPFPFEGVDDLVMLSENSAEEPFPQDSVAPAHVPRRRRAGDVARRGDGRAPVEREPGRLEDAGAYRRPPRDG